MTILFHQLVVLSDCWVDWGEPSVLFLIL